VFLIGRSLRVTALLGVVGLAEILAVLWRITSNVCAGVFLLLWRLTRKETSSTVAAKAEITAICKASKWLLQVCWAHSELEFQDVWAAPASA
jgi:hypothetical protein